MKKRGFENKRHRETEPDFGKKGLRWRFPLGPGKTLLTLLCVCILALSLSADAAWLIGYQYMIYFLYIGAFSTTLMLMIDASSLLAYWKRHRRMKQQEDAAECETLENETPNTEIAENEEINSKE